MLRVLAVCFALALSLVLTNARAEILRQPPTGNPAFVVQTPDGWTGAMDAHSNLQISAPDKSVIVQYNLIANPTVATMQPDAVAKAVFEAAHLPPYASTEPDAIAGVAGTAYIGQTTSGTALIDVRLIVARLDADHYALICEIKRRDISAASAASMAAMVAGTTVTGR